MKLKSLKLAALALASLAALAQSASAQTISTNTGDLILGVYQTNSSAPGYGNSYEVDLGSFTGFASSVSNLSLASKVSITDLDTIFGGSAGLAQTSWFVVGTQSTGTLSFAGANSGGQTPNANAVLITDSAANAPVGSDASGNTLGAGPAGNIGSLQAGLGGVAPYSSNSSVAADFASATPANAPQFSLNADINTKEAFSSTGLFYELNPAPAGRNSGSLAGTVTQIGDFAFVNGTTFTYNPVAAPEPSTYALMGLGALLLVITARRRLANL